MVALKLFSQDEYLLPTTSKPLIYLRFLKSYNYTPTIKSSTQKFFCAELFILYSAQQTRSTQPKGSGLVPLWMPVSSS